MIVNDKNEVKACRLLPRDIGREALFFLPCQSIDLFSVSLYHNLERNGTEWTGPEKQTTLLSWKINDQLFTESVLV
jgi:hypothetical protein